MPILRALNPTDRLSELLFGLIMVLTFTGSLSIAEAGRDDVRTMLVGAVGCNVAWGLIDAVLFVLGAAAERGEDRRMFHAVRAAADPGAARQIVANALPPMVADVMTASELDAVGQRLRALAAAPPPARLDGRVLVGACAIFLLVLVATFPVVVPFLIFDSAVRALRMSNAIAVSMLFVTGFAFGRLSGRSGWMIGLSMVLVGAVLVSLTIALGG